MSHNWNSTTLTTEAEAFELLTELYGKRWLCRGQPEPYGRLVPSIDRGEGLENLSRIEKLSLGR